jgi:hypothetical protein
MKHWTEYRIDEMDELADACRTTFVYPSKDDYLARSDDFISDRLWAFGGFYVGIQKGFCYSTWRVMLADKMINFHKV